jgi:hypothetical protein
MAIIPSYAGVRGMGRAIGEQVYGRDRGDWAYEQFGSMGDMGAPAFLKKLGSGVKSVAKVAVKGAKFVAKTGVNAALNKVGLGPVFTDTKGQALTVDDKGQVSVGPAAPNYLPWIIGGAVGIGAIVLLTRKK